MSMDHITIINNNKNILVIDFEAKVQEANRLRQILISQIPCMAVDKVLFTSNTSVATDEYICHRLGLIPIKADARQFEDNETFTLTLEAKGEGKITTIYSSQIAGDYLPVDNNIPIMKLGNGQEINAVLIVKKGIGADNAKWQTTCPVGFRKQSDNVYRITIESTGIYTPKEILDIGVEILNK